MSSFMSRYNTDKVAEENGVEVVLDEGLSVVVARLNNKKARELRRTLEKPYRHFNTIPENVSEDILIKVVSQAVLKGWSGVTDDAGKELPYSPAAADKLLRAYPDFLNDVVTAAMARETFTAEGVEVGKGD